MKSYTKREFIYPMRETIFDNSKNYEEKMGKVYT